ncbi:MAG: molybdopterin-dependent oxidoreductase, partial [Myxococcales bacterium]|nr:molybdopterin-dependent oxidoreductase [Myxococcales bacterium]
WRSRVRDLPEFGGEFPVATLADEILTPGDGQVQALVTSCGNPVLSTPDGKRLGEALAGLEFMVSIDIYLNETTRHAHLILPPRTGLEVPHYDLIFHALAVRNTAKWADPLFDGHPQSRSDAEIFTQLTHRISRARHNKGRGLKKALTAQVKRALRAVPVPQQVDFAVRRGPYGVWAGHFRDGLSLDVLRQRPEGIDLGPLLPQLPGRLRTKNKRIALVPEPMAADLKRLKKVLDDLTTTPVASADSPGPLRLIGRRALADHNSWLHNAPVLMGGRDRCTLLIHPTDAQMRVISDGEQVRVRSRVGEIEVSVKVSDTVMPGVVSLPHGWGHTDPQTRQQVANAHPGVSANDLTDPSQLDVLSGNAVLNGVLVHVLPMM